MIDGQYDIFWFFFSLLQGSGASTWMRFKWQFCRINIRLIAETAFSARNLHSNDNFLQKQEVFGVNRILLRKYSYSLSSKSGFRDANIGSCCSPVRNNWLIRSAYFHETWWKTTYSPFQIKQSLSETLGSFANGFYLTFANCYDMFNRLICQSTRPLHV